MVTGLILSAILCLLIIVWVWRRASSLDALYADEGLNSRVFASDQYRIRAKPDRVEGSIDQSVIVEYKHRSGRVYASDLAQLQAGALAVRSAGWTVNQGVVITADGAELWVELGDDRRILNAIAQALNAARLVKRGGVPEAKPTFNKCRACAFRDRCEYSLSEG